jgi:hypothetical protein
MFDDGKMLPEHTKRGIDDYVQYGVCGDFLDAVLANDLMEAFGRADDINRTYMFSIVCYVYNKLPRGCWGSKEIVEAWKAGKLVEREQEFEESIKGYSEDQKKYARETGNVSLDGYSAWTILQAENERILNEVKKSI